MHRSVETIRYTLKQFDQKHPAMAIFPDHTGPLTKDAKKRVYQQYLRGTSVESLAKRYGRTKASVYRVVNEMRAHAIFELPLDYMYNAEFDRPNAEKVILGPLPESHGSPQEDPCAARPAALLGFACTKCPLLTREQEQHLFRKFNYFKHRASKLRKQLDPARAKSSLMDRIEALYDEAVQTKNQIVQANLRLVVSIAKRHVEWRR